MKIVIVSDGNRTAVLDGDRDVGRVMTDIVFMASAGSPASLSYSLTKTGGENFSEDKESFYVLASDILGYKLSAE